MNNARILTTSFADGITLTATTAALPVANVQNRDVSKVHRTTGVADIHNITGDFGEAKTVTGMVIANHNLTASGQITVELSNTSDFSTVTYYSVVTLFTKNVAYKTAVHWFDDAGGGKLVDADSDALVDADADSLVEGTWTIPASGRYFRIGFYDPTNPDGYIEFGRLKIGAYLEPSAKSHNVEVDIKLAYPERGELIPTRGGGFWAQQLTAPAEATVTWQWIHDSDAWDIDANAFAELIEAIGWRDDVFLSVFPDDPDNSDRERRFSVLGRMVQNSGLQTHFTTLESAVVKPWQSLSITVREAL